jgi:broad specificity phosphatase PhoE
VRERVAAGIERIAARHAPDDEVLIVAHGGIISVYACSLLGCSFNSLWRLRVDNASLTVVRPPRLVSLNDTSHLGPTLVTPTHARASLANGVPPTAPAP